MDEIFGYGNLQREIVWDLGNPSGYKTLTKNWIRGHDTLLFYTKTNDFTFNKEYIEYSKEDLKKYPEKRKRKGLAITDVWRDIPSMQKWGQSRITKIGTETKNAVTGYPTQKPVKLLKRIIEASSNKNDILIDPFCGCGTTLVAAHELNRNWIGIDINDKAFEIIKDRGKQTKLDIIINAPVLIRKSKGIYEWVMSLTSKEHKIFEDWVNDFYGAVKPSPDRGVDGITKDGIPIQTKIYKVGYNIVSEFLNNAKYHPDVRIKKPLKTVKLVSQKGFDESAWQMVSEIKTNEGIKVELIEPKDMLKAEGLIK
jgi:hypothetical protein